MRESALEGKYIIFMLAEEKPKTSIWDVMTKDTAIILGQVKWYGAWRKYAFFPGAEMIFEEQCLGDIIIFMKTRTAVHKAK